MLIDLYGSRDGLLAISEISSLTNLTLSNIMIGTSVESQLEKEVILDPVKLDNISSPIELVEIHTDFSKRLRKNNSFKKSNIIILDFLHEGTQTIKFQKNAVTNRPVLRRYGYSQGNGKVMSLDDKVGNIDNYVNHLVNFLKPYELVIVNKLRNPKKLITDQNEIEERENTNYLRYLDFYAECFEESISQKDLNLRFIPEYKTNEELLKGYHLTPEYLSFLTKEVREIVNDIY